MFQVQMSSIWVENIPHFSFHGESGRGLGISGMAGPPPKPEETERGDLRPRPEDEDAAGPGTGLWRLQ